MINRHTIEDTCVSIEYIVLGMLANNVYIIADREATMVVDPSCKADKILEALDGRRVDAIILTHAHFDHVGAAGELREKTGAPVIASFEDGPYISGAKERPLSSRKCELCPVDREVADGDELTFGSMLWKVIATPGHTPGSICLYLDSQYGSNPQGSPVLLSGDTLFAGAVGRTDFEGGSMSQMCQSLKRLAVLPDKTVVLPGHQDITTIAIERARTFNRYA